MQPDEDWKDVQIPAAAPAAASSDKASETAAAPKAESPASGGSPTATTGEHKFPHLAQAGPAVNLLLAQYGIKPR